MRFANVVAVVSALVYGAMALIFMPILALGFSVLSRMGPDSANAPPGWLPLVGIVAYPALGGAFGWLFGGAGALGYNFVAQYVGGIEFETDEIPQAGSV